jgi:hypothetical protein
MTEFYTPYERTNHKNMPVVRPDDLASARFNCRFWEKMIEVSKEERVVIRYVLDNNIYYEAV